MRFDRSPRSRDRGPIEAARTFMSKGREPIRGHVTAAPLKLSAEPGGRYDRGRRSLRGHVTAAPLKRIARTAPCDAVLSAVI